MSEERPRDDRRESGGRRDDGKRYRDQGDYGDRNRARSNQAVRKPARVQPARRVAYGVIAAVREDEAFANLLLPQRIDRAGLDAKDAALATELTYGTLRRQGFYDRVIELAAKRPVAEIDPPLLDVLRLGAHQLLATRVAPHAAVDESVSLAREVGSRSTAGFANAVLRAIGRADAAGWLTEVLAGVRDEDERLAIEHSHPIWIVRALRRALAGAGRDAEIAELLAADNAAPRVSLTARPGLLDRAELPGTPTLLSPVGVRAESGDPARMPHVRDGRARVQDEGSQLAALALSRARPVEAGERWLDLCAGPGGKAALLAAEAAVGGATLLANEIVPARAELVRRALVALPEPPEVLAADGRGFGDSHPQEFDRIMLDAPCTGLGALRRRPEARWRKQPSDLPGLTGLQDELAESAARALKPGGLLAYVTCSPHVAETKGVLRGLLKRHPELEQLDTAAVLNEVTGGSLKAAEDGGAVQLWPHSDGTDAMFIALLRRTA